MIPKYDAAQRKRVARAFSEFRDPEGIDGAYSIYAATKLIAKHEKLTRAEVEKALYGVQLKVEGISEPTKNEIVRAYQNNECTVKEIAKKYKLSTGKLYNILNERWNEGDRFEWRNEKRKKNAPLEAQLEEQPTIIPIADYERTQETHPGIWYRRMLDKVNNFSWSQIGGAAVAAGIVVVLGAYTAGAAARNYFGATRQIGETKQVLAEPSKSPVFAVRQPESALNEAHIPIARNSNLGSYFDSEPTVPANVPKNIETSNRIDSSTVDINKEAIVHLGQEVSIEERPLNRNPTEETVVHLGQEVSIEPLYLEVDSTKEAIIHRGQEVSIEAYPPQEILEEVTASI